MNPMATSQIHNAIAFDRGRELADIMLTSEDADEIADACDAAAQDSDLSHATLLHLIRVARGWDDERTGVELANAAPTLVDLWTPQ